MRILGSPMRILGSPMKWGLRWVSDDGLDYLLDNNHDSPKYNDEHHNNNKGHVDFILVFIYCVFIM